MILFVEGFDYYPAITGVTGVAGRWTLNNTSSTSLITGRFGDGQAFLSSPITSQNLTRDIPLHQHHLVRRGDPYQRRQRGQRRPAADRVPQRQRAAVRRRDQLGWRDHRLSQHHRDGAEPEAPVSTGTAAW